MNRKNVLCTVLTAIFSMSVCAERVSQLQIDSLGVKAPVVNGGLKLQMTTSSMTLRNVYENMNATPGVGGEIGGFLDFNVTRHFIIQMDLLLSGEQMQLHNGNTHDNLWVFGLDVPLYLMGRWETTRRGSYIQFGGGPFTHFVLRSLKTGDSGREDVFKRVYTIDDVTGQEGKVLGDNYSGLGAILTYEWWYGLQLNANFHYSISDIINYEHPSSTYARPYKFSIGLGYRW